MHLVHHVIPSVPVRQWMVWLPISLRLLLTAQLEFVTPVLQVAQCAYTRYPLDREGSNADDGAVTLIQRFGSAAKIDIYLPCLVLDSVHLRLHSWNLWLTAIASGWQHRHRAQGLALGRTGVRSPQMTWMIACGRCTADVQ